jgi:nitronate monooxygenase
MVLMATRLSELLGIEHPIVQAPMAGSSGGELVVAVCNAGALGSLPCAMLSADEIRAEVATIRRATAQPFNLNFFCHEPPVVDPVRFASWSERLAAFYAELGVDVPSAIPTGGRSPFDDELCDLVEELRPGVVSFHFGLPAERFVERVKRAGATVLSSATTVAEARWLVDHGCDAVIAQGLEAGGHRGIFLSEDLDTQVGTFALVRQIAKAVRVPVIAAGGIADADGVKAALQLGAAGVQVGTAYLLCPEATITAIHRAALKSDAAVVTALTNVFTGRPARAIFNRLMREIGPISSAAPAFPLAASAVLPLRMSAEARGNGDFSSLWAGQNVSGCREIPAAELTRELGA